MSDETEHDNVHLHPLAGMVFVCGPDCQAVIVEHHLIAICTDTVVAEWIVELIDDHGLGNWPDSLACPWPAPDPNGRRA